MPASFPPAPRIVRLETIESTNDEAFRRARAGECGPLWIVARSQTAGRGRRGRTWISESGNLYASLLLLDPAPLERAPELSFVAALAVYDTLTAEAPAIARRIALKWPNDVLLDGLKLAGILVEGEGPAVVVGIGINCAHHPDTIGTSASGLVATDLAAASNPTDPERLFEVLAKAFDARLAQWDRGRGFESVRADWLRTAAGLGSEVRIDHAGRARSGRFVDIDRRGHLMLALADGSIEVVAAGDLVASDRVVSLAARR